MNRFKKQIQSVVSLLKMLQTHRRPMAMADKKKNHEGEV